MPYEARDKLIKHYNNPATPKQKRFFKKVSGVDLPAPITKLQGANWAIQAVCKIVREGGVILDTLLPSGCFATDYDTRGNPHYDTIKDVRLHTSVPLNYFYNASAEFTKAAENIPEVTSCVSAQTTKTLPVVDPFTTNITVSRTRITERL